MTEFVGVVVDLATAPFPLFCITLSAVAIVAAALNERKAR